MKDKTYEMDDDHKRATAFLVEQIAHRDEFAQQLKILPPEALPEARQLLADLDKAIERGEQVLADEYEACQKAYRLEDEADALTVELTKRMAGAYVHAKYRNPDMIPGLDEIIGNMPPGEAQVFYDYAAQIEAGDLIRVIAREGETREQTEEFLQNYRRLAKEELDTMSADLAERLVLIFIHTKYRHPEKLEEMRAALLNGYTPEEEQNFYDRAAILESGDLISLIARKGETREQTEEFLKNYRASGSE